MDAAAPPEGLVNIYQATRRHNSENSNILGLFVVSDKLSCKKRIWKDIDGSGRGGF
jgi:hypothetical protein